MAFAGLAWLGTTAAIRNTVPEIDMSRPSAAAMPQAGLDRTDAGVTLTGSVGDLFGDDTFSGPNRGDKRARLLPSYDVATFSDSFTRTRTHLAALRADEMKDRPDAVPSHIGPRMSVAKAEPPVTAGTGAEPPMMTAALGAIDKVDQSVDSDGDPLPQSVPDKLAYARANTPATTFETPVAMDKVSDKDMWCLATAIYFEARGEPARGQVAVAQVVLNRVNHAIYPDNICDVVFQNQYRRNACQFSFACDGIPERVTDDRAWDKAREIAEEVTSGTAYDDDVANATHYHATYVHPRWAPRMKRMTQIGLHRFYRFRDGWTSG